MPLVSCSNKKAKKEAVLGVYGSVENHREREEGALVYPVYSRRSRGLSVGINLFPDHKVCPFDCPYCEVFPFKSKITFSPETMVRALTPALVQAGKAGTPARDICFSGNGEPTLSPWFLGALAEAARIRDELAPRADLVAITNGAGLLDQGVFSFLRDAARGPWGLKIWLKLDAGTEGWYREMNRSKIPFAAILGKIRAFAGEAPVIIQTMICKVGGLPPPAQEVEAWNAAVLGLVLDSAGTRDRGIQAVQIYGKARPAPEDPLSEALEEPFLQSRALSLTEHLKRAGRNIPVEVFP
jgi:histidinol dehydrogenase